MGGGQGPGVPGRGTPPTLAKKKKKTMRGKILWGAPTDEGAWQ